MAKIDITKTELVWPGKYNEDGTLKEVPRVSLPFQVIETVNESRATREAKKGGVQGSLFDVYEGKEGDTFEAGWRNKLIWGDNLLVMGSLLEKFAGKIDLIYIDPPFATGADFSFTAEIGESGEEVYQRNNRLLRRRRIATHGDEGMRSYLDDDVPTASADAGPSVVIRRHSLRALSTGDRCTTSEVVLDEVFGAERMLAARSSGSDTEAQSDAAVRAMHDIILFYARCDDHRIQ